jgi:hypothetical protein
MNTNSQIIAPEKAENLTPDPFPAHSNDETVLVREGVPNPKEMCGNR